MKVLHAADFHLDSPLAGLPADKSALRRRELRDIPARLARLAREEGVDLVLLPGDLLDGGRVYPETVRALAAALGEMAVPVFIAPGNHDYFHPGSPYAVNRWPDNVYIFTQPELQGVVLPQLNCTVHGCAFTAPHREDDPLAGFAAPPDGRLHLLCLHGELGTAGGYAPIDTRSLERSGAAYAALGHIHAGVSGRAGQTLWAYPGCPEGRGFDELGEKGALYVEVEPGHVTAQFVPLAKRRYAVITADISGPASALDAILDILPGKTSDLICRLVLTGESEPPDLAGLEQTLSPEFYSLSLLDRTRLPRDLWARRGEDSLTGLFLGAMWEMEQAHPDDPICQLALRYGLAALEDGEEVCP